MFAGNDHNIMLSDLFLYHVILLSHALNMDSELPIYSTHALVDVSAVNFK